MDDDLAYIVASVSGLAFAALAGQILIFGRASLPFKLFAAAPPSLTMVRVLLQPLDLPEQVTIAAEAIHIAAWSAVPIVFRFMAGGGRDPRWTALLWGAPTAFALVAPWIDTTGTAALMHVAAIIALIVLGLVELEQIVRRAESEQFWIIKHAAIGLGALLGFNLFLYAEGLLLGRINPHLVSARDVAYTLCVPLMMASAARLQGYRREIRLSQKGTYQSVLISLVGLYFVLISIFGYTIRALGTRWDNEIEVVFIFGAILVLPLILGSAAFRANIKVMISKNFFTYRYDYREEWLRFVRTVSQHADSGDLKLRIIKAISNIVEATGGAIWIRNGDDHAYLLEETWNMGSDRLPAMAIDSSLPAFLARTGWIVDIAQFKAHPKHYEELELPDWLLRHERSWIVLPLMNRDQLIGLVLLGAPRVKRTLQWEDYDILKTVGRHAAAYLTEESILRDLSDARRLEAFNRRFAFVIHDIKNIVGQMSLMIRNADRYGADPEFQKDMMTTVASAVERLTHLMQQIRTESGTSDGPPGLGGIALIEAPAPLSPSERPLAPVIAAVVRRWQTQEPRFAADTDELEGMVATASPEDVTSVLDHLIQNAVEAIAPDGHVSLIAAARERDVVLSVADDGPGIDADFVRDKLFRPLVSGKEQGFGLGAFQCRELVRAMGGYIDIESAPGSGTRVDVVLPARADTGNISYVKTASSP